MGARGDERYVAVGGLADTMPCPVRPRHVLHTPDMGLRPSAHGQVVLAGDGAGSRVPRGDPHLFDLGPALLARARQVFPAMADVPLRGVRVGVRPMPADRVAVAGFADSNPGLYVVVTHSGVTLAPYLARLAAAEIVGEDVAPQLATARPRRFVPESEPTVR